MGQGSAMHETGQGGVMGTAGAAPRAGAGARTRQWHARRAGKGRAGHARQGQGKDSGMAGRPRRPSIIIINIIIISIIIIIIIIIIMMIIIIIAIFPLYRS